MKPIKFIVGFVSFLYQSIKYYMTKGKYGSFFLMTNRISKQKHLQIYKYAEWVFKNEYKK